MLVNHIRGRLVQGLIGLIVALTFGAAGAAEDPLAGDLRDLRVGMTVEQLPEQGYVGFACGNDGDEPGPPIDGWHAYRLCPANEADLHEVAFEYDEAANPWAAVNDTFEGTKVAGHPVIPSLLIDDRGVVQAIRIVTDPGDRMYLKKKAYLLYVRVMGRYGRDGWACTEAAPQPGYKPVGALYIDRRCEKRFFDRRLILETDLYRTAEQEGQEFTGATRLEIFKAAPG